MAMAWMFSIAQSGVSPNPKGTHSSMLYPTLECLVPNGRKIDPAFSASLN